MFCEKTKTSQKLFGYLQDLISVADKNLCITGKQFNKATHLQTDFDYDATHTHIPHNAYFRTNKIKGMHIP